MGDFRRGYYIGWVGAWHWLVAYIGTDDINIDCKHLYFRISSSPHSTHAQDPSQFINVLGIGVYYIPL
jgi:hypothetical protein